MTSYRGYSIKPDLLGQLFFIQKDGFTIATVRSIEEAKRAIDELVS